MATKKPAQPGDRFGRLFSKLLEVELSSALGMRRHFRFFELYVLTYDWVVLFERELIGRLFLVLGCVVRVTSTCSGQESCLISHGSTLTFFYDR